MQTLLDAHDDKGLCWFHVSFGPFLLGFLSLYLWKHNTATLNHLISIRRYY